MSEKVIDLLNAGRARELTAIMTYMGQHYELDDQGFGKLAAKMKEVGIQEMNHAEALAERILFLGGTPTSEPDAKIERGQEIAAMCATDEALEQQAIKMYNAAAEVCAAEGDHVSEQLFERLLGEEEAHLDYFQNVRKHLEQMGDAYMATLTG